MYENASREELLIDLKRTQLENQELKETLHRYRYIDRRLTSVHSRMENNHHHFNSLLSLLPMGVSICMDSSCEEILHNPEAARFLRIAEWESLSHSAKTQPQLNLQYNGKTMSPQEMPIQRSVWFGEYVRKIEIVFLWTDGVCKTSLWSSAPLYDENGVIIGAIGVFEDITERKVMEESLLQKTREAEDRLAEIEQIYKTVPVGLCMMDFELRYRRINKRFAEINGASIENHLGRTPQEVNPARTEQETIMRKVLESGQACYDFEISTLPNDQTGKPQYWNQNILPIRDKSARIIGLGVTAENITKRKTFEMKLNNYINNLENIVKERTIKLTEINDQLGISEERFRLALANSPVQVFNQDRNLCYTWVYNLCPDYTLSDVIGKTDDELFPHDNYRNLIALKRSVLEDGLSKREEVALTLRTGRRYFDLSIYPLFGDNGSVSGITCVSSDITELKNANKALQQSEERFAKVFHSSPVMMAIVNRDTSHYINANEAWIQTFGQHLDSIQYTKAEDMLNHNKDLYEKLFLLKNTQSVYNYETMFLDVSGQKRYGLASSEIIYVSGKDCILQTILDITEKKQMEREFARLDRLNLIGEMAASIGHEIRNPLTSIRGFLQLLGEKHPDQEQLLYYELMIEELDRTNEIITEFLSMAKYKKVNLERKYLDAVIQSLYPMIQSDANHKDMNVQLDLNHPPQPLIDVNEIKQLILNLARNGLDAMSSGGTLTIGTCERGNEAVLYVRDEGPGLKPEIIDKIGTPFLTTKEAGTGLGLAVCYRIAAQHNAKILIETGQDGTTFYIHFTLPD